MATNSVKQLYHTNKAGPSYDWSLSKIIILSWSKQNRYMGWTRRRHSLIIHLEDRHHKKFRSAYLSSFPMMQFNLIGGGFLDGSVKNL